MKGIRLHYGSCKMQHFRSLALTKRINVGISRTISIQQNHRYCLFNSTHFSSLWKPGACTLPKMQLDLRQLGRWFGCVVATNVASSFQQRWEAGYRLLVRQHAVPPDLLNFQTCRPDRLKWHHWRKFPKLHTAPSRTTKGFVFSFICYRWVL